MIHAYTLVTLAFPGLPSLANYRGLATTDSDAREDDDVWLADKLSETARRFSELLNLDG